MLQRGKYHQQSDIFNRIKPQRETIELQRSRRHFKIGDKNGMRSIFKWSAPNGNNSNVSNQKDSFMPNYNTEIKVRKNLNDSYNFYFTHPEYNIPLRERREINYNENRRNHNLSQDYSERQNYFIKKEEDKRRAVTPRRGLRDRLNRSMDYDYNNKYSSPLKENKILTKRLNSEERLNPMRNPEEKLFTKALRTRHHSVDYNDTYKTNLNNNQRVNFCGENYQNLNQSEDSLGIKKGSETSLPLERFAAFTERNRQFRTMGKIEFSTKTDNPRKDLYSQAEKDFPNENKARQRKRVDDVSYEQGKYFYDSTYKRRNIFNKNAKEEKYEIKNINSMDNPEDIKKTFREKGIHIHDIRNENDNTKPKYTFILRNEGNKDFEKRLGEAKKDLRRQKGYTIGKCEKIPNYGRKRM
ncbi:MAG: hypothetical protein MJ252_24390 [archaeon]|nr:hypothetical protein [archaeon]